MTISSVLIQGAAGFIGQSLLPRLAQQAGIEHLILVDRKSIPDRTETLLSRYPVAVDQFINSNLLELGLAALPDLVISLAGMTNVDESLQNPKFAFDTNISIVINLGEWLRQQRKRIRLIYVSSDEVLGETFSPLTESAHLNPTQPYAASKAAAEIVLHNYRDVYQLDIVTLRSCNLIGGHLRAPKLIPVTIKSILLNRPVPVYEDGSAKREWMAVEDLCEAVICLMNEKAAPGIYHASSGIHLSVHQVLDIISKELDFPMERQSVPGRLIHDRCYFTDTAKLRALGWLPKQDPLRAIADAARQMTDPTLLEEFKFEL